MLIDINGRLIVNNFKTILPSITFIPSTDHPEIIANLDIFADTSIRKGKYIKYSRSKKTTAAAWLWKYFFTTAFKSYTSNTRGVSELIAYYQQFIHYEILLFALDENHRDHVIHSVWVMLIGFYLRHQCNPMRKFSYHVFSTDDEKFEDYILANKELEKKESSLWILIAVTHDIGYPIQKTLTANNIMSKMIDNFGFLTQTHFSYQFNIVHQTSIEELLNLLSTQLFWQDNNGCTIGIAVGTRLDYAKSFERLDHGIMSAYLLLKYLDEICNVMNILRDIKELRYAWESATDMGFIATWLAAIASHTNNNRYWTRLDDIEPLLFLSDELDEFSRYAHKKNEDQWINVECETKFNCTRYSINFNYTIKKRMDFDTLSFFKGKIEKFMDRFELEDRGIRKISISCDDSRPGEKARYYYERRYDSNTSGMVKRLRGKSSTDIVGFLNGEVIL